MPPRTLKRRANAISCDTNNEPASDSSPDVSPAAPPQRTQPQTQGRPRLASEPALSDAESNNSDPDTSHTNPHSQTQTAIKKLVRLALASEYARQPIRRTDITAKILRPDTATAAGTSAAKIGFRAVFLGAQRTLRDVFGMEMVDLPVRERTGLNERRKAAGVKGTQKETQRRTQLGGGGGDEEDDVDTQGRSRGRDPVLSAASWVLVSTLPEAYRVHRDLLVPSRAPDEGVESTYVALYTLVIALLYLHSASGGSAENPPTTKRQDGVGQQVQSTAADDVPTEPMSDAKLQRYLSRLNLAETTPMGVEGASSDKFLARMMREGYIERRRDNAVGGGEGEEVTEWVVGPRGKREVGRRGVAGLVRGVYGFGVDGRGRGLELPGGDEDEDDDGDGDAADGEQQEVLRRRPVKMEKHELERRLKRTLGDVVTLRLDEENTSGLGQGQGQGQARLQVPPTDELGSQAEAGPARGGNGASTRPKTREVSDRPVRRSGRRRDADDNNDDE